MWRAVVLMVVEEGNTHTEGETKNNGRQRNHLTTTKVCFLTFEDPIKCNDVNLKHFPGEA